MFKYILKTKDVAKNILLLFLVFLTLIMAVCGPTSFLVHADVKKGNSLDVTDPLEDLRSDANFNLLKYPYNVNGKMEIAFFSEYCYTFYTEAQDNYALYVYIYNPQAVEIIDSPLNKIQMAVGYDKDGNPNEYEKFALKLCSYSKEYNFYRLFYKFKVVDHLTNGLSIYDRLNSNQRRYDVSGVELLTPNELNATDNNVSTTYYYTGYAKGCGPNFGAQESTLQVTEDKLETVSLNVDHTFWRSKTSNKGQYYQNQLDTVYFTVPNRFLEEYGKLQRIKAEWYEYKTKDIIVTSNKEFYNAVCPYLGAFVGGEYHFSGDDYGYIMQQDGSIGFGLAQNYRSDEIIGYADWVWNCSKTATFNLNSTLYYLLPTKDWSAVGSYDPYADTNNVGDGSENALLNYIMQYDASFVNGKLPIKNGTISADLFEKDIDDYRKIDNEHGKIQQGYSYYDFDADVDILEWQSYKPNEHAFWENAGMFGLWKAIFKSFPIEDESFSDVSPILLLEDESLVSGSEATISDRLHVNFDGAREIKDLYYTAKQNDETVVLFRFALSDYYSAPLSISKFGAGFMGVDLLINNEAYRATQSVFFDFDVIQLTFQKEEELKIIPVVASPIDVVNNPTPPTSYASNLFGNILAWVLFISSCIAGTVLAFWLYKMVAQIYSGSAHVLVKVVLTAPLALLVILISIYVIPWVTMTIFSLGGL